MSVSRTPWELTVSANGEWFRTEKLEWPASTLASALEAALGLPVHVRAEHPPRDPDSQHRKYLRYIVDSDAPIESERLADAAEGVVRGAGWGPSGPWNIQLTVSSDGVPPVHRSIEIEVRD